MRPAHWLGRTVGGQQIIIGKASIYFLDDGIYLASFEIFKQCRGNGYANIIMQILIGLFSIDTLIVRQGNTIAVNLYKKHGFQINQAYYAEDLKSDVYYMKRERGKTNERTDRIKALSILRKQSRNGISGKEQTNEK